MTIDPTTGLPSGVTLRRTERGYSWTISVAAPSIRISEQDLKQRALGPVRNAARDIARALEAAGGTAMTH